MPLIISHDSLHTIIFEYSDENVRQEFTAKKAIKIKNDNGEEEEKELEMKCIAVKRADSFVFKNNDLTKEKLKQIIGETDEDLIKLIYKDGEIPKRTIMLPKYSVGNKKRKPLMNPYQGKKNE